MWITDFNRNIAKDDIKNLTADEKRTLSDILQRVLNHHIPNMTQLSDEDIDFINEAIELKQELDHNS